MNSDPLWFKDAIIYELHIKAFNDSNKDGIGDFNGLIQRLDYLHDLGVTAIWLLPFYPSPQRDGGYDISNYYAINPDYGSLTHFKKFLKKAHALEMKVITELVLNHTSDQHPWFQRARKSPPGSKYRNFYVWSDNPDKYKDARIIFQDFETSNWSWDPEAEAYYWHRFYAHQPDLNFESEDVQKEVFKVLDFWIDLGVDGFRLDAVPYLFERDGTNCENLPETHAFLKKLRERLDRKKKNTMLLAEANMWPEDSAAYFGEGNECHMNYHFPIMPRMFMAIKMEDRYPIIDIIDQTPEIPANCQWAIFLRNHDELTLEMVTDEERDYMYKVYNKEAKSKINLGIRHRLAPLLDNNRRKIELMNSLLFSLPGTPVIYYGDEIGMGDNVYLGDRDGVRTPMQWSTDRNSGFSYANPQKLYLPLILDPEYSFETINAETQLKNPSSLLWWMKLIIDLRKKYKAFGRGNIQFLSPDNPKVLTFLRTYEEEKLLIVANLSRFSQAVEIDLSSYINYYPVELFSHNRFPPIKSEPYLFTLGPHSFYWLKLEEHEAEIAVQREMKSVLTEVKNWNQLFSGNLLNIWKNGFLERYLNNCSWFYSSQRKIYRVEVFHVQHIIEADSRFFLLFIQVDYNEGLPEMYFLPLSAIEVDKEKSLNVNAHQSIIGIVKVEEQEWLLYDANFDDNYYQFLYHTFLQKKRKRIRKSGFNFYLRKPLKGDADQQFSVRLQEGLKSNTSLLFNEQYFLKQYRRIDTVINPDLEICNMLTENADFPFAPRFLGALEYEYEEGKSFLLGILQEWVPNQGNARNYFIDTAERYFEQVLIKWGTKSPNIGSIDPLDISYPGRMSSDYRQLIPSLSVDRAVIIGETLARFHDALGSDKSEAFKAEPFSLHYQRSLYSSQLSLIREVLNTLEKRYIDLDEETQKEAENVLVLKSLILQRLKRIYLRKFDAVKIRIHGDLRLDKVLFSGKDFYIFDFEGEAGRSFSEKRLKKSNLRDVVSMIRSFHYVVYSSLFSSRGLRKEETQLLQPWAECWYSYQSAYFLASYLENAHLHNLVPSDKEDLDILLESFLLEAAFNECKKFLDRKSDFLVIALRGIQSAYRGEAA